MNLSNLSIAQRLALGFSSVLILLIMITTITIVKFTAINDVQDEIMHKDFAKTKLATVAIDNARGSMARVFQMTTGASSEQITQAKDRFEKIPRKLPMP